MTKKTWIGSVEREKDEKERKIFQKVKNTWGEKASSFFFFFFFFSFLLKFNHSSTNQVPIEPTRPILEKQGIFNWSKNMFD